jgi:pyruvate/2-oxoglutarate/acetoin dehydrogenase E1 component
MRLAADFVGELDTADHLRAHLRTGGAEVVSIIGEEAFWDLDGPSIRITTPHIPLPSAASLEDLAIPSVDRIYQTVRDSMDTGNI